MTKVYFSNQHGAVAELLRRDNDFLETVRSCIKARAIPVLLDMPELCKTEGATIKEYLAFDLEPSKIEVLGVGFDDKGSYFELSEPAKGCKVTANTMSVDHDRRLTATEIVDLDIVDQIVVLAVIAEV